MQPKSLKTFIIYARNDESFKNELLLHLKGTLIASGRLQVWQDGDILPGEAWEKKIEEQLEASELFLVLLSIHSLTSDFIQKKELMKALEKKNRIVPIHVRACLWQSHPVFAGLQGLPKNMKPVASFSDPHEAWTEVMGELFALSESLWEAEKRQKEEEMERRKWMPEMIFVKGGTFQMGDIHGDLWDGCRPVHQVTLPDFEVGKYPVTQKEWIAVMGANPSRFKGDDLPVENVSWAECQEFLKKLNEKTGKKFRLPTEAEWEFAARGGTLSKGYQYAGSNDLKEVGWFSDIAGSKTHPVGQKKRNELDIHDMSGNVWEWCNDWYDSYTYDAQTDPAGATSGTYRVLRGGGWGSGVQDCRASYRGYNAPGLRGNRLGFRLASSPQL